MALPADRGDAGLMVGRLSVVAMPRWLIAGTVFVSGVVGACRLGVMVDGGHRDVSERVVADPANGGWEEPGSLGDARCLADRGSGGCGAVARRLQPRGCPGSRGAWVAGNVNLIWPDRAGLGIPSKCGDFHYEEM